MSPDDRISLAAAKLKALAPAQYEEFLAAFTSIASQAQATLLSAPEPSIMNAQGQAQIAARILKTLRECSERSDHLQRRT